MAGPSSSSIPCSWRLGLHWIRRAHGCARPASRRSVAVSGRRRWPAGRVMAEVSSTRSASRGSSYGSDTPVKADQARPGLGVQALAIACRADLDRGDDMDQQEVAHLGDHPPDIRAAAA